MRLKPASERSLDADGVGRELQARLGRIPGIRVFVQNPPPINIGGRQTKSLYQYTLQGSDIDQLYASAQALEARLRELPELRNVTTDLLIRNPQIRVAIDRERASAFGVTPAQVEGALYTAYGAAQASTIYTATNQYAVVIELLPEFQRDLSAMRLLSVRGSGGTLVPLTALATVTEDLGPLSVNHSGQLPVGDALLRPRARGLDRPGRRGRPGSVPNRDCPRGSPRASAARPRPSRTRSAACSCCWCSPSW